MGCPRSRTSSILFPSWLHFCFPLCSYPEWTWNTLKAENFVSGLPCSVGIIQYAGDMLDRGCHEI
jgi:hypothetical protein